jgi:hypothetical protein
MDSTSFLFLLFSPQDEQGRERGLEQSSNTVAQDVVFVREQQQLLFLFMPAL